MSEVSDNPPFLAADLIYCEARSGSASWDELGGPGILMTEQEDGSYVLTIPQHRYDDDDKPLPIENIVITVEVKKDA